MQTAIHSFHIPVMGTGFSIDTPIRVGHLGIDSVVSIVDDLLCERMRKAYAAQFGLPFTGIARNAEDGRARRIAAYLDLVQDILDRTFGDIRDAALAFSAEKRRYFELLADSHPLAAAYKAWSASTDETTKRELEADLSAAMRPGSIDVNIMAKVDRLETDAVLSDAVAALKGFAMSRVRSAVVLSAGFNPRLYSALAGFPAFYRDADGGLAKRIILKVSDFRSAMIQGKFLAKKGLEVTEFRIESGLNCGGHAFYSDGRLLPAILAEFRDKFATLKAELDGMVNAYYASAGREYAGDGSDTGHLTVQGGIGTAGETARLHHDYGIRRTGWGSPFLVVPEATNVDAQTMELLIAAGEDDLYLSQASPLGVPFNNVRGTGSHTWHHQREDDGKPGSPCPKGFLKTNTEFTAEPICTASTEYMLLKLAQIEASEESDTVKEGRRAGVLAKQCLCDHLGNPALIGSGVIKPHQGPQAVCPGPNLAWFKGPYSLDTMVGHIYGRGEALTPAERPHMFIQELRLNIDYLEALMRDADPDDAKQAAYLDGVMANLREGIRLLHELAGKEPFPGENLATMEALLREQEARLSIPVA